MEEFRIKDFLEKFKDKIFKKEEIYNAIKKTIFESTSIMVDTKMIKIVGDIIYIKTTPIIRNEIFLKKGHLLSEINKNISGQKFSDFK